MWQLGLRVLAKIFNKQKWFKHLAFVRLMMVLSLLVLFTPPYFVSVNRKESIVYEPKLPMPQVRFVRPKINRGPKLAPTQQVHDVVQFKRQLQVTPAPVKVQPPDVFGLVINPEECMPWDYCAKQPTLQIRSIGPTTASKITKIQVQVRELGKVFDADAITIRLPPTSAQGDWLYYWAIAEDGTRSSTYAIKYLSYRTDAQENAYYFALLGTEWNTVMPSGSLLWQMFPPVGSEFPVVLERPLTSGYLYTTNRYSYLAGRLIFSGKVNAKSCADGGIYATNGYATPCGDQQAAEKVLEWQNRYDQQIFDSSVRNHIPAKILKAMIAQETQFWPESKSPYEIGLGSLTENGVDMLLAWNMEYFLPLCTAAYGNKACLGGYSSLNASQQTMLRQSVWERALVKTNEMDVLGAVLFASAAQVNQMLNNTMHTTPGEVATYEDMWKITVANYHSGSGCIGTGMNELSSNSETFTWKAVSSHLLGDCNQAITYVENVWRYAGGQP